METKHDCDTCKYRYKYGKDIPCIDCDNDFSNWEVGEIPVEWIEEKMEKSVGFRHAVLSEMLEEWRGMNESNDA